MKILSSSLIVVLAFCSAELSYAQGFGTPLTFQGLDHFVAPSSVSRGAGGVTVGLHNDIDVMFQNPASLGLLNNLTLSVSNLQHSSNADQIQQYGPLSYYSNFSLLMEGLTGNISTPAYDSINHIPATGADTVQRPFDGIGPNWYRSSSNSIPFQGFAAVPLTIGGTKLTVGVGMSRYSDLDWYFQNNNVLDPSVLSVDPNTTPIPLNTADSNSIPVNWSQYYQRRTGSIDGIGGALSVLFADKLSIGISGMVLSGSSDDIESTLQRGRIRFYSNYFRLEPVYSWVNHSGTSDYSGTEFTLSALYKGKHVTLGFSIKPETKITRKYTATIEEHNGEYYYDSLSSVWGYRDTGTPTVTTVSGEDKMTIPLRGSIGLSLAVRENLTIGMEYEMRPYASAKYSGTGSATTNPWISSNLFHIGIEYLPLDWLTLRSGVHEQAEVFQPEGNPIDGEPIMYTVYSAGIGLTWEHARLNLTYEYGKLKYTDMWASAVSLNSDKRQNFIANVSYEIP